MLTSAFQWANTDSNEEGKVHQQKLRVTYLPAEGQTLEEEDENVGQTSILSQSDSVCSQNSFHRHILKLL